MLVIPVLFSSVERSYVFAREILILEEKIECASAKSRHRSWLAGVPAETRTFDIKGVWNCLLDHNT